MNTKSRYEELKQQIHSHNYRYHVPDAPVISDLEFDKLLYELKRIEADHPDWITPTRDAARGCGACRPFREGLGITKGRSLYSDLLCCSIPS